MNPFAGIVNFDGFNPSKIDISNLKDGIKANKNIIFDEVKSKNFYLVQGSLGRNYCPLNILHSKSTNKYVLFNGRIDNRLEIKKYLKISKNEISDDHLFLKLYMLHGEKALTKIYGSFVAVVFDYVKNEIKCFKDHIGSKPLFYFYNNKKFVFSNSIKSITKINSKFLELNHDRITDYLLYIHGKKNQTFYKDIYKLQRAELLIANKYKLVKSEYYKLNPNYVANFTSTNEVSEAFRELFKNVIKEQSSDSNKIGSKLSGGIDSSAITSVLAHELGSKNIISYSALFKNLSKKDFKLTDEKEYMNSVIEKYNLNHRFVDIDADKINPFDYLDGSDYDEPTPHANRYFEVLMLEQASKDGTEILFDGFDGDTVLSYGMEYLNELGKKLYFKKLFKEAKKLNRNQSYINILKNHFIFPMLPNNLLTLLRYLRNNDQFQKRIKMLKNNRKFIFEKQYNSHFNRKKYSKFDVQQIHLAALEWPIWEVAMEFSYKDSLKYGIDERYPFFDRRIMEFCLSIPGKFRLKNGISRYYFRKSMNGYLPQKNINRITKANISPLVVNFLQNNYEKLEDEIFSGYLNDLIDRDYLENEYIQPFLNNRNTNIYSQLIFQIICINKWTKKTK